MRRLRSISVLSRHIALAMVCKSRPVDKFPETYPQRCFYHLQRLKLIPKELTFGASTTLLQLNGSKHGNAAKRLRG